MAEELAVAPASVTVGLVITAVLLWTRRIPLVVLADCESCVAAELDFVPEAGFVDEGLSLQI